MAADHHLHAMPSEANLCNAFMQDKAKVSMQRPETLWVLFHGPPSWRNSEPGRQLVRELATGIDARLYNSTECSANVSINGDQSINWYLGSAHEGTRSRVVYNARLRTRVPARSRTPIKIVIEAIMGLPFHRACINRVRRVPIKSEQLSVLVTQRSFLPATASGRETIIVPRPGRTAKKNGGVATLRWTLQKSGKKYFPLGPWYFIARIIISDITIVMRPPVPGRAPTSLLRKEMESPLQSPICSSIMQSFIEICV